jgi:hypothetical protein
MAPADSMRIASHERHKPTQADARRGSAAPGQITKAENLSLKKSF